MRIWVGSATFRSAWMPRPPARSRLGRASEKSGTWRFGISWLQDKVRRGEIKLVKVWGKENPADVLTKPMSFGEALGLLKTLHLAGA